MIEPAPKRSIPISPALAVRVATVGVIGFALFAIVFLRLWFLQVLSGDQYLAQATQNRVRVEPIQAPRGDIVDRNGDSFVVNRQATVLRLKPSTLPEAVRTDALNWVQAVTARSNRPKGQRGAPVPVPAVRPEVRDLYRSIAKITDLPVSEIQERVVTSIGQVPYAEVRVKSDVSDAVRNYVEERQDEFPGVTIDQVYVRRYPLGSVGSQLVGTVSEISPDQLKSTRFKGVKQGTVVGQEGLEYEYDRYLRGTDGRLITNVDASGTARDGTSRREAPTPGRQVQLSLDLSLQRTAERALSRFGGGKPGAFVAMDPEDGQVYAIGSEPNFDPNVLSKPISQERYDALFGEEAGSPRFNRAISSVYPVGSTFKPITAFASVAAKLIAPSTVVNDTGCTSIGLGPGAERCNAGKEPLGPVNLVSSLKASSDVYYYLLGRDLYNDGRGLQTWAHRLGMGSKTGVDLPAESAGNVPDRAWRAKINRLEARCAKKTGAPCGYADGTNRPYSVGDNVSLAVGQGDLQATPIQMARLYASIANGGKLVTPHLGERVQDEQGRLIQGIDADSSKRVDLPSDALSAIRQGLHEAASAPGGTSAAVFTGWPQSQLPIFGKTGTAQTANNEGSNDQSWYVAYVPRSSTNSKPLVVAATIEKGGFGAAAAAPTVCRILAKWYDRPDMKCVPGTSNDQ